jgi:hypothetical protein
MRIIKDEWAVRNRLHAMFGVTLEEVILIVREVVGARADAVENDPINAAGSFAYIHGTRNVRALLRSKGWLLHRKDNMELVRHPDRPLTLGYQNVDLAASEGHNPQAISAKGRAAERAIEEAQGSFMDKLVPPQPGQMPPPILAGLWHFCVSVFGNDVRAEISLSTGLIGGNFEGFVERIFILKKGDWEAMNIRPDLRSDAVDFEPIIRRKT